MLRILLLVSAFFFSVQTEAAPIPAVQNFIREQLKAITTALDNTRAWEENFIPMSEDTPASQDKYYFGTFELRVAAGVGYMLPWAANVALYPEIELSFER